MTLTKQGSTGEVDLQAPLVVISADAHIGPRLEDMRAFCPREKLGEYDAWVSHFRSASPPFDRTAMMGDGPEAQALAARYQLNRTAGHHDVHQRLREMDADGCAAELIFHGSQNGEPVPFVGAAGFSFDHTGDQLDMTRVGLRIYNETLAAQCSVAPERLLGAAQLPLWDVGLAVDELLWACEAGLRRVSFSAPRPGIPGYDKPEWEPFWSACEDLGMALCTHTGAIDLVELFGAPGPHMFNLIDIEAGGWPARRGLSRLIFSGVFERHPTLTWIISEANGEWWSATVREYDSSYLNHRYMIKDRVPELPSHYMRKNVYIGASFMAPFEAEMAVNEGYASNVIWGRDYPHVEGTWQPAENRPGAENVTHMSMRFCFSNVSAAHTKAMVQDNGVRALGLDLDVLTEVACTINAPTLAELATPVETVPEGQRGGVLAFRTVGAWY